MLDETQQRVFDRLSVFAGPFTIEAAEVVVAGDGVDDWSVLDGVLALVDKSLVVVDERGDESRYRLFETMRQFGLANLSNTDVLDQYRARHGDYFAEFVLSRRPQLFGAGDQTALDAIERELENLRVALRRAADDDGSSRFEELCGLWRVRPTRRHRPRGHDARLTPRQPVPHVQCRRVTDHHDRRDRPRPGW